MMEKELIKIFQRVKALMKKYEDPLTAKIDLDSKYDLWSIKTIEIDGRKRKEVYFAGLIIQSTYVGFYFMPIYADGRLEDLFPPELLNCLKGKSCFHLTYLDRNLEKQISDALKKGYALYQKRGWV